MMALVAAIEELRRDHVAVADAFYSCPKSESGCDDPAWSADECSCGADEHNARVDALLVRLTGSATPGLSPYWDGYADGYLERVDDERGRG